MPKGRDMIYWMPCKRATELISVSLDRNISIKQRLLLHLHLRVCRACVRFRDQLLFLRKVARPFSKRAAEKESSQPLSLTTEARERIKRALQK